MFIMLILIDRCSFQSILICSNIQTFKIIWSKLLDCNTKRTSSKKKRNDRRREFVTGEIKISINHCAQIDVTISCNLFNLSDVKLGFFFVCMYTVNESSYNFWFNCGGRFWQSIKKLFHKSDIGIILHFSVELRFYSPLSSFFLVNKLLKKIGWKRWRKLILHLYGFIGIDSGVMDF